MAFSGTATFEVRTDGDDLNGGGFNTGAGTNRSLQASPHIVIDGATISAVVGPGTNQLTLTGHTVVSADHGNYVNISGGTATASVYEITGTSGGYWTLDRSPGTVGQTATGRMGGAFGTIGKAGQIIGGGNQVCYVKYSVSPHLVTVATANVPGGFFGNGGTANRQIIGYDTTRTPGNTDENRPTIKVSMSAPVGTTPYLISFNFYGVVRNLILDADSIANIAPTSKCQLTRCFLLNFKATPQASTFYGCFASGCTINIFNGRSVYCVAFNNSGTPFYGNAGFLNCVSLYNTSGAQGFAVQGDGGLATHCVAYGNDGHGFNSTGGNSMKGVLNCISVNNGGWGFVIENASDQQFMGCAAYGNTSGSASVNAASVEPVVALSGDPFVDGPNGDLRLNATTAGLALRNAAWPNVFPNMALPNESDIGAAGHEDAGGGGGTSIFMRRVRQMGL
jgi:hypothetical protein